MKAARPKPLLTEELEAWRSGGQLLVWSLPLPHGATEGESLSRLYSQQSKLAEEISSDSPAWSCYALAKKLLAYTSEGEVPQPLTAPSPTVGCVATVVPDPGPDRALFLWAAMILSKLRRKRRHGHVPTIVLEPFAMLVHLFNRGMVGYEELVDASFVVMPFRSEEMGSMPLLSENMDQLSGRQLIACDAVGYTSPDGSNWHDAALVFRGASTPAEALVGLFQRRATQDERLRERMRKLARSLSSGSDACYLTDGDAIIVEGMDAKVAQRICDSLATDGLELTFKAAPWRC